jgi:hypothetical protein
MDMIVVPSEAFEVRVCPPGLVHVSAELCIRTQLRALRRLSQARTGARRQADSLQLFASATGRDGFALTLSVRACAGLGGRHRCPTTVTPAPALLGSILAIPWRLTHP